MAKKVVPTSLRLEQDMVDTLEMIAAGQKSTVSDVIRTAIAQYLNPNPPKEDSE